MQNEKKKISAFILIFNMLWLFRVFLVPKTNSEDINFLVTVILKFLIFVALPCIYAKLYYKENLLDALKFNRTIKNGIIYSLVGTLIIFIVAVTAFLFSNNSMQLKALNLKDLFIIFVFAGFMEEILFRGFILKKINKLTGFGRANLLTALLFTFIHMPQSIANDTIFTQTVLSSLVFVFTVCLIYSWIFIKSNSLWAVIILHGVWNCAVHVLGY